MTTRRFLFSKASGNFICSASNNSGDCCRGRDIRWQIKRRRVVKDKEHGNGCDGKFICSVFQIFYMLDYQEKSLLYFVVIAKFPW
ncbi:MAG: hypothetical protein E3K40_06030 [Candidatus Brocadia sp.]|nr:hypothetical protein [Candidatus Brocadia sp.]MDG6026265.1 hypothetical protein [Candidatus Brocadia sp.]